MADLKIKTVNGRPSVWINGNEIEDVEECTLDLDARRVPMVTLKVSCINIDIETFIREEAINLDRYELKRNGESVNSLFDKAYDNMQKKKNKNN